MFSIQIPDHTDETMMPKLYHWKKVKHLINELEGEIVITNTTVETKLHPQIFFYIFFLKPINIMVLKIAF